jgi:hypothetical protein
VATGIDQGDAATTTLPASLAALVVKNGVSLGLLDAAERDLVLALAATHISSGRAHREAEVNVALKAWLDGSGAMIAADHVELRRWLVDLGFVARDGFGREYRRGPRETERAEALLGPLSRAALDGAIAATRAARAAQREARRRAHAGA